MVQSLPLLITGTLPLLGGDDLIGDRVARSDDRPMRLVKQYTPNISLLEGQHSAFSGVAFKTKYTAK